jgi:hypothetical protein
MNPPLPPTDATLAAIEAVVSAIERCPAAVAARDEAALTIRAAQAPGSDLAAAEHDALRACAAAAVYVLESDPALAELVTVAELGLYIFHQAVVIATGSAEPVELVLLGPLRN